MHSSMLAIFFAIGAPVVSAVATVNSELGCVCMVSLNLRTDQDFMK